MDPVYGGHAKAFEVRGNGFISRYHKLLDNHVAHIPLRLDDSLRSSLYVKENIRLRQVKIKAALTCLLLFENTVKLFHHLKAFEERSVFFSFSRVSVRKY